MRRDPADLASTPHDLVVIGGGIHGLMAAYDAASRGLTVALVERGDFGGLLSSNHQRTIHGGLRDVGAGRFTKARKQIAERRAWARMAPRLLRPLPFLIGTYGMGSRSRLALGAGFAVYDWLGRGRNEGIPPELSLPATRLESVVTTQQLFPGIDANGLTGGAVWYDYQTQHPDRLNWTVAVAAMAAGARVSNYVEAVGPIADGGRVAGVRVRDLVTGHEHDVPASAVLLAAGSALGTLHHAFGVTGAPPLISAMNLLIDRPAPDIAVVARGTSGRMLTAVPWRDRVLVGTFQSDDVIEPGAKTSESSHDSIEAMLADANKTFPALAATPADVCIVHRGLVPAIEQDGRADLLGEPRILSHAAEGRTGVYSLVGVKYTSARHAAELTVDLIARDLKRRVEACGTASAALPHAGNADAEGRLTDKLGVLSVSLDTDVVRHLIGWYGTEAPTVVEFSAERGLLDRVSPTSAVLSGEIAYAAAHAHAVHLADAVMRRTPLGSAGHPGEHALQRAAVVMGEACGWTDQRREHEVQQLQSIYPQRG